MRSSLAKAPVALIATGAMLWSTPALAIPPASDPGTAVRMDRVLVMGDSIQLGVGPVIKTAFGGIPVDVVAEGGQTSLWGLGVLPTVIRPDHDVVVFDMGTNDDARYYELFEERLREVIEIVGDRCLVIATITHPAFFGATVAGMNEVIRRVALESTAIQLVNWREMVLRNPGLLWPDAIHPTTEGNRIRGGMITDAIAQCPSETLADEPASPPPPLETPAPPAPPPSPPPAPEPPPKLLPRQAGQALAVSARAARSLLGIARRRPAQNRAPSTPDPQYLEATSAD